MRERHRGTKVQRYKEKKWRTRTINCFKLCAFCLCAFVSFFISPAKVYSAEKFLYIKSDKANLMEKGSSNIITTLKRGDRVRLVTHGERFYQVALEDKREGRILKFKLTEEAPEMQGENLFSDLAEEEKMASVQEASSGSSIRAKGGRDIELTGTILNRYIGERKIPERFLKDVYNMEDLHIGHEDRDRFMNEGGLGEYGKVRD